MKKSFVIVTALLLTLMMAATVICYGDAAIEEYWETSQYVDADYYVSAPDGGVNLRQGPGTEYNLVSDSLGLIPNGTKLHIYNKAKADNGKYWGDTSYNGYYGWVFLGQCTTTPPSSAKTDGAGTTSDSSTSSKQDSTVSSVTNDGQGDSGDTKEGSGKDDSSLDGQDNDGDTDELEPEDGDGDLSPEDSQDENDGQTAVSTTGYSLFLIGALAVLIVLVIALTVVVVILIAKKNKKK